MYDNMPISALKSSTEVTLLKSIQKPQLQSVKRNKHANYFKQTLINFSVRFTYTDKSNLIFWKETINIC